MESCHFPDNDRTNNNLSNLRWDTPKANGEDKIKNGTSCRGEASGKARLREQDVILARKLFSEGATLKQVAATVNVSKSCVSELKRGATWAWFNPK